MSAPSFQFRQFVIHHDRCAHRVGTDGVLLGAWARIGDARRILDIGTGSGLIALMAAQRTPHGKVVAVEIDEDSFVQACRNVDDSPFADRVGVVFTDVRDFQSDEPFDCILCNPPFFTEDTLSPDVARARARHAAMLDFTQLIASVQRLLSSTGVFHVILPINAENDFVNQCFMNGLNCVRRCHVSTVPRKSPKRVLLSFSQVGEITTEVENLVLQNPDGTRSAAYADLTKDFYL